MSTILIFSLNGMWILEVALDHPKLPKRFKNLERTGTWSQSCGVVMTETGPLWLLKSPIILDTLHSALLTGTGLGIRYYSRHKNHRKYLCSVLGTAFSPCQCHSQKEQLCSQPCGGRAGAGVSLKGPVCMVLSSSPQGCLSLARAQVWWAGTVPWRLAMQGRTGVGGTHAVTLTTASEN